jgi:O-antigen biosynthesis protein WbqP
VKRLFDISLSICLIALFSIPLVLIAITIKLTSEGPALYWSERIGVNNSVFRMPKFRSMRMNTPIVATHLLQSPDKHLTKIGKYLRKYSIDELPQLFSVLIGDMSFVGPRPALYNQHDLIQLRTEKGVHRLIPGITGWAQVNGRDELPIPEKVDYDEYYLKHQSFALDLRTILRTLFSVVGSEGVTH